MQWDMWNPWACWYELHSTHPLVARRLEYLADQAAALGQRPAIVFDRARPESYWDEFAIDLTVVAAPILGAALGLAYGVGITDNFGWSALAPAIVLGGFGLLIKTFFRYSSGPFDEKTVAELLAEVKVSPVRPVPAVISGTIVGRGIPGLIYSEDFVMRDDTGIIFVDYQQPFAIWNWLFGLLRAGGYRNTPVTVTGWFRRAPVPYFEILEIEDTTTGRTRTCYSSHAAFISAALLILIGSCWWFV